MSERMKERASKRIDAAVFQFYATYHVIMDDHVFCGSGLPAVHPWSGWQIWSHFSQEWLPTELRQNSDRAQGFSSHSSMSMQPKNGERKRHGCWVTTSLWFRTLRRSDGRIPLSHELRSVRTSRQVSKRASKSAIVKSLRFHHLGPLGRRRPLSCPVCILWRNRRNAELPVLCNRQLRRHRYT